MNSQNDRLSRLSKQTLTELAAASEPPCLSLYQPTHRHYPENRQDPIRFRNLLEKLEQALGEEYEAEKVASALKSLHALADDQEFWNHTLDGLAVLGALDSFRVFTLPRTVPELAIVADTFHTKPLWRFLQSTDRYQVLALTRDRIRLYEGDRDALDEIELAPDVPRTLTEALGAELTEPHSTVASYGGNAGGNGPAMHHGQGGKEPEIEIDDERFFRAVDRAVLEQHSQPSGLPLMLAALSEHQSLFRKVSHNAALLDKGVETDPASLSAEELREQAWQVMEPQYRSGLERMAGQFEQAKAGKLGLDDLEEVAKAAVAGRVGTLLLEADRQIAGRIDAETGSIQRSENDRAEGADLLDDLGEMVRAKGGEVTVIPAGQMPTQTGAAATCRY